MDTYEKKYKNALEWARQVMSGETGFIRKEVEEVFPELKESEDESIRKRLIELLKKNDEQHFAKEIAWLKKQGEQPKKNDVCNNCDQQGSCVSPCPMKLVEKQGEHQEYPKDVIDNAISFLANRNDGMPEKEAKDIVNAIITVLNPSYWQSKVSRPANKVEPKFKVGDIIKPKDEGHEPWKIMQVDISDKKYRFADGYVIHFSQEKDYELVEQKPADWSEEDEETLDYIIAYIEKNKNRDTIHTKKTEVLECMIDFLKSLKDRLQLK